MRRIALPLLAVIALGAGCGGGGGGGTPLSADEFAKQANAICKAGDVKLAEEGKPLAADPKTTPDQLAQFYRRAYLRWIDATKRNPALRAERIAAVVALLERGVKARP